ncbi:MAG TPA: ATP-binding protein, partial [Phycisphaerae bacterium]|nr:ATP-binding protein [Phycisphaerae bacterium]
AQSYTPLRYNETDLRVLMQVADMVAPALERAYAEESLQALAREWQTTFDAVADAVWLLDGDFRILRSNKSGASFLTRAPGKLIGHHCWEVMHGTSAPPKDCPFVRLRQSLRRESVELALGDRWCEVTVDPILDKDGHLAGAVHVISDITDRKKSEEHRQMLEAQLRQSQKMEAVGQLAGGIAHDFNNLLMVIQSYTDLARQTLPFSSPAWEALEHVTQAATQAVGATRSLLTFSRQVAVDKKPVDLRHIIEMSVRMVARVLPNSIQVVADVPGDRPIGVLADAIQIQQVILNLAINARDAMPEGGTLRIAAATSPANDPKGPTVLLTISDTGCGISPETMERIFEPFFSTKTPAKGTGLGLSVVHGILGEHGGSISVASQPGQGTTFTILLPRFEGPLAPDASRPETPTPHGRGELILLAEDHEQVQAVIKTALEALKYEVLCVSDGEALLETFHRHRDRIAVILADIDMPKRSGLACLKDIRGEGCTVPAILITAAIDPELDEHADEHAVLVRKPLSVVQLAGLVAGMIGRRHKSAP